MPSLVSIVIPCYNAEPWIAQTIESALGQSWPEKEIIVVDDGSRDRSLAIARGFESQGIRVLAQANRGASAARNAGLAAARGEFIQYLDADDLLSPDKIERQMDLARQAGPEFLISGTWGRFHADPAATDFYPQPLGADLAPVDWLVLKFERHLMMHPAAWLTSRTLAARAGPWDERLSSDDDGEYFTRVVLASRGVRFCRGSISYYRSGLPSSLSQTKSDKAWRAIYRAMVIVTDHLIRAEDSPRTRHACATAFQRFIYQSYPLAVDCRRTAAVRLVELGGSDLEPEGGPKFQRARRILGWKLARRLQQGLFR